MDSRAPSYRLCRADTRTQETDCIVGPFLAGVCARKPILIPEPGETYGVQHLSAVQVIPPQVMGGALRRRLEQEW